MVPNNLKRFVRIDILLVVLILVGVFFRFYQLDTHLLGDEVIYGIASMKFHRESFDAGKNYVREHPPLGKWFIGLPAVFIEGDYSSLRLLGTDLFVWSYMTYGPLSKNYVAMRTVEAIGGVIALFLIFLISKQLFGTRAALWSTVIASLSFEMIGYSRIIYMETPMIVFTLLSLFLYINYLKSSGKRRTAYFIAFLVSITITLLTRGIQPIFLLPIFVVCQFLLNRNIKENVYFLLFLGISYFIAYQVIFPFDIVGYGPGRYGQSNIFGLVSFKMFTVIGHLIFRNSLLFLAALIATGYIVFQAGKKIHEKINPVVLLYFGLAFLIFSFLSFPLPRHYIFMFLPLYIIGGYALNSISKNKVLAVVIVILALVNVVQLPQYAPYFLMYTNFGLEAFQGAGIVQSALTKGLDAANSANATRIMTNDMNTLIFFKGDKLPLTPSIDGVCNNETIDSMDLDDLTVIYVPHSKQFNLVSDPYVCPMLKEKLSQSVNVKVLEV
ncbi:MAG: phospholipid carrier-dependent glycosyltransferase [Candidatus Aenigmarchaeota archaeon]|nr:phospholipid carrier-dependent glycosyltransferase [Candidatus Aenigmarchaeota archaeon]